MALGDGYGLPVEQSQPLQNAVDIMDLLGSNTPIFQNPTTAMTTTVRNAVEVVELPPVTTETQAQGWTTELREQVEQSLADAGATLDDFQAHTDSHISNMGPRMAQFEADNQLEQTVSPTPTPNVCDRIMNFFGSLLGQGSQLLNGLLSAIQSLINLIAQGIQALVNGIAAVLALIANAISQILNLIASELAALANALARALRYALGSLLSGVGGNSCLTLLLGVVGTGALLAILARR